MNSKRATAEPDTARIEDEGAFYALIAVFIGGGIGVLTNALGLEPVVRDVIRALGS